MIWVVAAGVILVASGRNSFGFYGATAFACGISFVIKLTAVAMQQKLIGELMSGNLSVRRIVGVNSIAIKAIQKILEKPGLSLDKVFILIGGPDWPTSVLTGILHLPLLEMLLGTTPVFFLIVPTVAAGAFLLRADENGPYAAIGNVALVLAGLTQFLSLIGAAYYIEQIAERDREELEAIPKDQEVLRASEEAAERHKVYRYFTQWQSTLPAWARIVLVIGSFASAGALYINLLFAKDTFEEFQVTDTIAVQLDGNALNLVVVPLGWVVVGLIGLSILIIYVYGKWSKRLTTNKIKGGFTPPEEVDEDDNPPEEPEEPATDDNMGIELAEQGEKKPVEYAMASPRTSSSHSIVAP